MRHVVEVVYDGEDLDEVGRLTGRTRDEVIALHAGATYEVERLGFLPGFAYLRGLPPVLELPRREPRPRVPRGSVGIAASYSGIYPAASAGGWHLLGRAPAFVPFGERGPTFAKGDEVRFEPRAHVTAAPEPEWTLPEPKGAHLELTRATGFAVLVDGGRPGRLHEGVPPGGPLVRGAFARANAALGNDAGACAIELSGTFELVAHGDVAIAMPEPRRLRDGERITVATDGATRVRYVAVAGGVDAPLLLGSPGVLLAAGFGRVLRKGDRLSPRLTRDDRIRVVPGPDAEHLPSLLDRAWEISVSSDRTGTRLVGAYAFAAETLSRPPKEMARGAIELTPSGPIVLGPDHPATGGYPVVAVVHDADQDELFARALGSTVRFTL